MFIRTITNLGSWSVMQKSVKQLSHLPAGAGLMFSALPVLKIYSSSLPTFHKHVFSKTVMQKSMINHSLLVCGKPPTVLTASTFADHVLALWCYGGVTFKLLKYNLLKSLHFPVFHNVLRTKKCIAQCAFSKFLQNMSKMKRNCSFILSFALPFFMRAQALDVEKKYSVPVDIPLESKRKEVRKRGRLLSFLLKLYGMFRLFLRAVRLFLTFMPVIAVYPVTYLGDSCADMWWALMLKVVEISGPIFVKLGQWVATRRDLFPETCCNQFLRLQRRANPHSWHFTKYRLKQAFGPHWRKIFVKFDYSCDPVGSGCAAQVYKAWMRPDDIPDDEVVKEILSEMEDEESSGGFDFYDGIEVLGFSQLFRSEKREIAEQMEAIQQWKLVRDKHKAVQEELKRRHALSRHKSSDSVTVNGGDGLGERAMLVEVADKVATEISGGIEQDRQLNSEKADSSTSGEEETAEHALVKEWEQKPEQLEKTLPTIDNTDQDDIEGLIPVAVKVLHPGIHAAFRRDLKIMQHCANLLTLIFPSLQWMALPQCVDEFAQIMSAQINLKKEAEHLERFSENFANISSVKFPRPLRPYVTSEVMVETYEEGESMLSYIGPAGEDKPISLKKNLAAIGVDMLIKMIFSDNFVHADIHPGNVLVQNDSPETEGRGEGDNPRIIMVDVGCDTFVIDVQPDPKPLRICLLDCGVVASLSEKNLRNFKSVFQQVALGNGEAVADLFLAQSEHDCRDPNGFRSDMAKLLATAYEGAVSLGHIDVGVLLQQLLSVLSSHRIRLESAFSSVVIAVFVLEGLGRSLDKEMDILERARPILV